MSKLKKRHSKPNKIGQANENTSENEYPIFCFRHLDFKPGKDARFYLEFVGRLNKISNLTWLNIKNEKKHGYGTEKIPIDIIKKQRPSFLTPDVKHLLVFRATGDNRPFLGIRKNAVFHILFIEEKFGDIYDHG